MNIGSVGYSITSLTFFIFFTILVTDKHKGPTKKLLLAAAFLSSIWSLSMSYQAVTGYDLITPQVLEFIKSIAWITLLLRMLSVAYGLGITRNGFFISIGSIVVFVSLMTLPVLYHYFHDGDTELGSNFNYLLASHLLLSVIGIVLVEQLYRNTQPEQRWVIKFLCLGLGGMYVFDFYMYSDGLLYKRIDLTLWHARGFVDALVVPLIGIAVIRDPLWSPEIFISRKVVFHTTTLLASAVYLMTMGIAGYYVRDYGGSWGLVAQAFLLFFTILSLLLFLFSERIRARWKVLLNKHFYPYKYDYRDEWLRFIRTISSSEGEQSFYTKTIISIAQIIDSPGGMLWLYNEHDGLYECVETYHMPMVNDKELAESSLVQFMAENEFVISVDEFYVAPEVYKRLGCLELPSWVDEVSAWLIVPLIHIDDLIGFIVLNHSRIDNKHFNWEDSDLLNTVARQAASFIVQREVSEALAEARQFENYNKLSTYMVHDIKNLVTQLSLITSNAEKHKANPLFVDDVIKTIINSVDKMNIMMNMLQGKSVNKPFIIVNIIELLHELVINRKNAGVMPAPILTCKDEQCNVVCDREQLFSIVGHLIQNAQDATESDGRIDLILSTHDGWVVIEVKDTGCGMSDQYIKNELFKPFKSTKGGRGMGIGVYEVREIITSFGGKVDVASEVGVGTSFKVMIPAKK
ncbi:MAG: PEP-CTERM system histidine kinase PrsK [Gammaproteobacteria bacterium]|nr:PEP-CTERM system histidine kinase PrsK [Gammaproteobacteria bacterium]